MTYNNIKNIILPVLFAFMALASCIDEDFLLPSSGKDYDIPEGIKEGYSINLAVTLDKMGGTRAASGNDPLEEIENYIDPEKFRVLVFDSLDKFLFESKSRWVKKLNPNSDHSEWLVSIPVFTYGDDTYEAEDGSLLEWDWERIREALTKNKFKIAILANRPELDWYPSFSDLNGVPAHWYDNRGPYWTPEDTGEKDVFDLHHCQYDPMYHGKSTSAGYYDFVMGGWDNSSVAYESKKPTMSATASWVNWTEAKKTSDYDDTPNGAFAERVGADFKYTILPDHEHPIPMYGIQEFEPITNWTKGTPFHLSELIDDGDDSDYYEHRSIFLLRSVVRVDLLLPKKSYPNAPRLVGLWYSNIYSRCEPMDVWTPTNLIWEKDHENKCEWRDIMDYGLVASQRETKGNTSRYNDDKTNFQKTISWFYGAWLEKNWKFETMGGGTPVKPQEVQGIDYPRIFNPCVQRNKFVIVSEKGNVSNLYNDEYWHFVAYTGERNMIDPNTLPKMVGSNSYATTWMFKDTPGENGNYFFIPIADYSKDQTYARKSFGPYKRSDWDKTSANGNDSDNYPYDNHSGDPNYKTGIRIYGNNLRDNVTSQNKDEMPWPLLRNHIYRITVTGPTPTALTESYTWDFTKSLNATTVYNLTNDANWANPGKHETQILSHDQLSNQEHNGDRRSARIAWWGGSNESAILTRRSNNDFNPEGSIAINGISRGFIKTGKGENAVQGEVDDRTTTLTVSGTKKISKLTLYSYVKSSTSTSNSGVKQWAVSSAPTGGKASVINDDNGSEVMRIRFGVPQSGDSWKLTTQETKVTYPSGGQSYTFSKYVATEKTNGSGGTLAANGSTEANYISVTPKFDGKLIIYVHNMGADNGSNGSKNTVLYEDGVQKEATLIGTDSKGTKKFNGNDDIYVLNGNKNYTGGFLIEVKAGKTYTMSMKGSKTRWQGVIFDYVKQADNSQHYWADVTDNIDKCGPDKAPLKVLSAQNSLGKLDTYAFEFNDKQSVSFTSGGTEQICYVASVEIEDENGTDYWKLNTSSNGELKANGKTIPELQGLKFSTTGSIYIYETVPSKIRLTGATTITFPTMPEGTTITINGAPVSNNVTNWITPNGSNLESNGTNNSWKVKSEGTAAFTFNGGSEGVDIYEISVVVPANARSTRTVSNGNEGGLRVQSEDLHSKSIRFSRR